MSNKTPAENAKKTKSAPSGANAVPVLLDTLPKVGLRAMAWTLTVALTIATVVLLVQTKPEPLPVPRASVRGITITLELAESAGQQQRGLTGHAPLDWREGMLFPARHDQSQQCFWMKDVGYAIDIIWLDNEQRIVQTLQEFEPESYPEQTECGPAGTAHAIELRSGSVERYGLRAGDHVILTLH